jgi:hypothetical protein
MELLTLGVRVVMWFEKQFQRPLHLGDEHKDVSTESKSICVSVSLNGA